jgi:hypothetical protein
VRLGTSVAVPDRGDPVARTGELPPLSPPCPWRGTTRAGQGCAGGRSGQTPRPDQRPAPTGASGSRPGHEDPHPAGCPATISRRALICTSRFPAAFPPPAFASWPSFARPGDRLSSGRPTSPPHRPGRTQTGFPRSARTRHDRGGRPLYPGDDGAHPDRPRSPPRVRRFSTARPCTPPRPSIDARLSLTKHQRGFKQIARPDFPSRDTPGWIRSASGFPPSSAPRDYSRRTPGRGQGLSSTDPKPALRHQPNLQPRGFT